MQPPSSFGPGQRASPLSPAVSWLLYLLVGLALLPADIQGAENGIGNDTLWIQFAPDTASITAWQIRDTTRQGTSFVRDLAAPDGHLLRVGGHINAVAVSDWERQAGGWRIVRHTSREIDLELSPPEGEFILRQSWALAETAPWQADFSLSLQKDIGTSTDDRLWIDIGPGIGETPTQGLGIADRIYSYTEIVHAGTDAVQRSRLDTSGTSLTQDMDNGWIGLQTRYFALILSPASDTARSGAWEASTPASPRWHPQHPGFETVLRIHPDPIPTSSGAYSWTVYGGGKSYHALGQTQPNLREILFPGLWNWMRALTIGLMFVLGAIHGIVGNWGVSIILLAVVVRLLVHPLARRAMAAQKRFVATQEKIQPELAEIKKNYKGGEQSERILQLYEKHNTSPFAGLKPLLIVMLQIPVFIALYHLLGQMFELRNEPFLWMNTLAEPDQLFSFGVELPFFGAYFNLLPALMALTTIASIRLSPAPAADAKSSVRQSIMLTLMTLSFFLIFYSFPSGMVLYWTMANLLHLLHGLTFGRRAN